MVTDNRLIGPSERRRQRKKAALARKKIQQLKLEISVLEASVAKYERAELWRTNPEQAQLQEDYARRMYSLYAVKMDEAVFGNVSM